MTLPQAHYSELLSGERQFVAAMRALGATSSATAVAHRDLPSIPRERFRALVQTGVLREGAPGTFYLYEQATPMRATSSEARSPFGRSFWLRLPLWLAALLLPLLLIRFTT
jgi:hypothetical protein